MSRRKRGVIKWGTVFKIGRSPFWYAWRYDVVTSRQSRCSTGCSLKSAATKVAQRWHEEYERAMSGEDTPARRQLAKPLATHIEEFVTARRVSPAAPEGKHLDNMRSRLERIAARAGWTRIDQISEHGFSAALDEINAQRDGRRRANRGERLRSALREAAESPAGTRRRRRTKEEMRQAAAVAAASPEPHVPMSPATKNHYRANWKTFTNWLYRTRRLPADPLLAIDRWKTEGFETFGRRALTREEYLTLELTTDASGFRYGISGPDRAALYRLAVQTGFRRNELASLTPRSFDIDGPGPVVWLGAMFAKNRKPWAQPILGATVAILRRWLAARPRDAVLWPGLADERTARMLYEDMAAAGLSVVDADGRIIDFHALRHTFITWLARSGVPSKLTQRLARHSTERLTDRHYTHITNADLRVAMESGIGNPDCAPIAHSLKTSCDVVGRPETSEPSEGAPIGAGKESDDGTASQDAQDS